MPDADRTLAHLKSVLHRRAHDEHRSALKVSTVTRDGLAMLVDAIDARFREPAASRSTTITGTRHPRSILADDFGDLTAALVRDSADTRIDAIIADMAQSVVSRRDGVMATVRLLAGRDARPELESRAKASEALSSAS